PPPPPPSPPARAPGEPRVILNSPEPVTSLSALPVEQVRIAAEVWRKRMRAHADAACLHLSVKQRREAGHLRPPPVRRSESPRRGGASGCARARTRPACT